METIITNTAPDGTVTFEVLDDEQALERFKPAHEDGYVECIDHRWIVWHNAGPCRLVKRKGEVWLVATDGTVYDAAGDWHDDLCWDRHWDYPDDLRFVEDR